MRLFETTVNSIYKIGVCRLDDWKVILAEETRI